MNAEQATALRAPFPPEQVGKLPKAGTFLDYVGHAAVTSRLLEVDPCWNWRPLEIVMGEPRFVRDEQGRPVRFWIELTICGVSRLGVGTVVGGVFDAEKQLIGDALRNAAMRFGVAIDLWIKGHVEPDNFEPEPVAPQPPAGFDSFEAHDRCMNDLRTRSRALPPLLSDNVRDWWEEACFKWPLSKLEMDTFESVVANYENSAGDGNDPAESRDGGPESSPVSANEGAANG